MKSSNASTRSGRPKASAAAKTPTEQPVALPVCGAEQLSVQGNLVVCAPEVGVLIAGALATAHQSLTARFLPDRCRIGMDEWRVAWVPTKRVVQVTCDRNFSQAIRDRQHLLEKSAERATLMRRRDALQGQAAAMRKDVAGVDPVTAGRVAAVEAEAKRLSEKVEALTITLESAKDRMAEKQTGHWEIPVDGTQIAFLMPKE